MRLYQDQESIERGFYSKLPIASVSDNGCSEGGNHDGVRLLLRIVVVRHEMKDRD